MTKIIRLYFKLKFQKHQKTEEIQFLVELIKKAAKIKIFLLFYALK